MTTHSGPTIAPRFGSLARDPERSEASGGPGVAAGVRVGGENGRLLEDVGGAKLLAWDVRIVLLLLDEAQFRIVRRVFGVSRDQSRLVTLIALALIAQAARTKADQMLRGPGGPTRADAALGAVTFSELLTEISGLSSTDTQLIGTLVAIAAVGSCVRPALRRTAHGSEWLRTQVRHSFNDRYGHLLPTPAIGRLRHAGRST